MKQAFQERQENNKVSWDDVREILFRFKRELDVQYRNMFWHFTHARDCERCNYWDNVYVRHLAGLSQQEEEINDQEMLAAAEALDASS